MNTKISYCTYVTGICMQSMSKGYNRAYIFHSIDFIDEHVITKLKFDAPYQTILWTVLFNNIFNILLTTESGMWENVYV